MISLKEDVRRWLEEAGAPVWFFHPAGWTGLPSVSWRESRNREFAQADGMEHLAELEYTVDVWGKSPEEVHEIAGRIDRLLAGHRLRRDYAADLFDSGLHRRTLRYRCVADAEGKIYQ
jgi:hypothetical protein